MHLDPAGPRRAYAVGSCAAVATLGVVLLSGLVPGGLGPWLAVGAGGALLAGALAAVVQVRVLRPDGAIANDARLQASRMQIGLAAGLLIKLTLLVLGSAVLVFGGDALGLGGLKFEAVSAFAIAFAAASLIQQVCTAALLSRRAHARS